MIGEISCFVAIFYDIRIKDNGWRLLTESSNFSSRKIFRHFLKFIFLTQRTFYFLKGIQFPSFSKFQ